MPPSWTIAIPTYNGAAHLSATLESVLSQSDGRFELIVCDDASTDNSVQVVEQCCGQRAVIHLNESGRPIGLAANWNRCMEKAQGEWLTILHQDDLLAPDFLESHLRIVSDHLYLGMITGPVAMIDGDGLPISMGASSKFHWPEADFVCWPEHALSRVLVQENPIRCPGTSFRRELGLALGGFDGRWKYVVDWDFWHRLGQASSVALTGRTLASQRWHGGSETQKLARGTIDIEENGRIMRSILTGLPFTEAERPWIEQAIRTRLARAWWARAWQAARRGDRSLEIKALQVALKESPALVLKWAATQPKTLLRLILGGVGV